MKNIYLFHYHFITGGVTTVVNKLVDILKNNYQITIFASKEMGVEGINDYVSDDNVKIKDFPELKYIYPESTSFKNYNKLKEQIYFKLEKIYKNETIFWVHNYHLGKNPAFTSAFIEFISKKNIPTILQIHDFPECARWQNYKFLKNYIHHTLYPVDSNIFYAVINKMDYERLKKSGIPEKSLFYFPNSVSFDKNRIKKAKKIEIRKKVINRLKELTNINYDESMFLYPTRTIRRKNILEAVLINRIYHKKSNLIVTLGANSKKERKYEKAVKNVFKNKRVRGVWAISKYFPDLFPKLMKSADLLISTSLLEGFGLLYLESKKNSQNFFTRKLDILKDFDEVDSSSYYCNLMVYNENKKNLIKKYYNKINDLPLDTKYKNILKNKIDEKINNDIIDFSYLDVETQKKICLKENVKNITQINPKINSKIDNLVDKFQRQGIETSFFSYDKYEKRINMIIKAVEKSSDLNYDNCRKKNIDDRIMRSFLKVKYIRLLFDY